MARSPAARADELHHPILTTGGLLADETLFDPISGTAVLNGIPVDVRPAASTH